MAEVSAVSVTSNPFPVLEFWSNEAVLPLARTALIVTGIRTMILTIVVDTISKSEEYKLELMNAHMQKSMLLARVA